MFIITLSEIIGLIFISLFMLFVLVAGIKTSYKQWKCKHLTYRENMACHGICKSCGKDLGFIGTLREKNREGENG